MIPAGSLIQQQIVFQQQGTRFSNILHYRNTEELTDSNEIANLTQVQNDLWLNTWKDLANSAVQMLGSIWKLPLNTVFGSRTTFLANEFGTAIGDPMPTSSYVIIRRYSETDGPNTRGRTLVAGLVESWAQKNVITDAGFTALDALVTALRTNQDGGDAIFIPQNFSPKFLNFQDVFKTRLDPLVRSLNTRQPTGAL